MPPETSRSVGYDPRTIRRIVNLAVVEQHAADAAFGWRQRAGAACAHNYKLRDLARLDGRLEAHLRGLTLAGNAGWAACEAELGQGPDRIFPAAVIALREEAQSHAPAVIEALVAEPKGFHALVSGIGWCSPEQAEPFLKALLARDSPLLLRSAMAGYAAHRVLPDACFERARTAGGPAVLARVLRAVGEVGLVAKAPWVEWFLEAGDATVRAWAAWSLVLCGQSSRAIPVLAGLLPPAAAPGPTTEVAVDILARSLRPSSGREMYRRLWDGGHARLALLAALAGGWPEAIDEVVQSMQDPRLARLAGLVFVQATGLDLGYHDLEAEPREESGDDDTEADPRDALLPWPDPGRVATRWSEERSRFARDARVLRGAPITEESALATLREGTQIQRRAAALERTLLRPGTPVYPTARRGLDQARDLLGWT
jgi:uncharacterized protein (TIGR02270 family)